MRILLCHNRYVMRTGEDIAFDSMRVLLERGGHELLFYMRDNQSIGESDLSDKLLLSGRAIYSTRNRKDISNFAKREKPAVAIVQNVFPLLSPSIYYGLAESNIPIIQLVFNYRILCANGQLYTHGKICERCVAGNYLHGFLRRCYRESYMLSAIYSASLAVHRMADTWRKCVQFFVVPDKFLGSKLVEGNLPADRMRTIPNAFDIDSCRAAPRPGDYALFVGVLSRPKGILTLLDAIMRCDGVRLIIVGDGPEKENVRRHPAVLTGRAELIGAVYGEQLNELMRGCAFLVVPSEWYDNLPMVVCQAFATARPVIASRINGIPEYVRHEDNGLLFPPGDSQELASAMQRLFSDTSLQMSLSRRARQTAEELFHPKKWMRQMDGVLEEAIRTQPDSVRGER
jgi:glycosyltransferase involved in cell wall biosynthesis